LDPKLEDYLVIDWTAHGELPMSIWELRAAKRFIKQQGLGLRGQEAAFLGRQAMHSRTEQARQTTKTVRKENAKRAVREDGLRKVGALSEPPAPYVPNEKFGSENGQLRVVNPEPNNTQSDDDEVFTYTDEELRPNWRKW